MTHEPATLLDLAIIGSCFVQFVILLMLAGSFLMSIMLEDEDEDFYE